MGRFDNDQLEIIRDRIDIVGLVERYVTLKRTGRNLVGLCPFHKEKTPSFHVHRDKQFFHCFGCKESGDLFDFVMKIERVTFPEAVERLATEAGVVLATDAPSPEVLERKRKEERWFAANALAAKYYFRNLFAPVGKQAVSYLRGRGVSGGMARRFQLGFAERRWDGLLRFLSAQGVDRETSIEVGLAVRREGREPFDLFRNRLMFPITDVGGRVVGFGGRSLTGEDPKYINTPQTELFSKREHLYGLAQAKEAARREGRLIVCEGYTDVISLAQCGIENSVAALGTAFTAEQAKTLSRWCNEVILAFDADLAGRSATDRGLDLLSEAGLVVRVAMLPEGEDPDSLIRSQGRENFCRILETALPLTEYKIEEVLRAVDVSTVEGRLRAVEGLLPILATMQSPVAREGYIEQIAARVGSSPQALQLELRRFLGQTGRRTNDRHRIERSRYTTIDSSSRPNPSTGRPPHATGAPTGVRPQAANPTDERALLRLLLDEPEQIDKVYRVLGDEPFQFEGHNHLYNAIRRGQVDGNPEEHPKIAAAIEDLRSWEPVIVLDVDAYLERVWERQMRRRLRHLEVSLTRLPERDGIAYAEYVGSLLQAYKRLRQAVRRRSTTA